MNQQELTQKLAITGGQVTLSVGTLTPSIDAFLVAYNAGLPIVVAGASSETDEDGALVVTGRSNLLGIPDLPVTATFLADDGGEVHARLRYQLRDAAPGPDAWIFSRSFPELPAVLNYDTPLPDDFDPATFDLNAGQIPLLDALALFDTAAVLTTHEGTDPTLGLPLDPGINIVSRMRPQGALGVLESVLGADPILLLRGVIRLPKPAEVTIPLQPLEHPWDRLADGANLEPAPGIYLEAALDAQFQLGGVTFHDARFHVYSPVSSESGFEPVHGYSGTLDIPSAGVSVDLGADMEWNLPQVLLYGSVTGVTFGELASLADAAGTGDLLSRLPSALQSAVDGLGALSLNHFALDLCVNDGVPAVRGVHFIVGLPGLEWKVWGDDLVVKDLECRFGVSEPFGATSMFSDGTEISVGVLGTIDVAGVPLRVEASNDQGFTIRAFTREAVAVPLDTLISAHAPGLPVPSALTVDAISATVVPGEYYSMSALAAGEPEPWVIPIGKDSLTISDIGVEFEYPAGGPATGSFGGRIAFGDDLTLTMAYDVPGSFFIRGDLPPMKLSKVIDRLCDQRVDLPGGFDIDLEYSSIVIQDQAGILSFQLLTEVSGLGVLVFEARGGGGAKWGFAFGLDLTGGLPSAVPGLSALSALENALRLSKFLLVASSLDQPGFQLPDTAQFSSPQLANTKVALPGGGGVVAGLNVFAEWELDASDKSHKLLRSLLGLGATLQVTVQIPTVPADGTRLFFSSTGELQGHPFVYQLGVQLAAGQPSLFLSGDLTVSIQGAPTHFSVAMLVLTSGFFFTGSMLGAVRFGSVTLSNLGLVLGVNWAGIPSLGITASLAIEDLRSSLAILFDSTDPSKSLLAGSVAPLTLRQLAKLFAPGAGMGGLRDLLSQVALEGTGAFELPTATIAALDGRILDDVATAFLAASGVELSTSADLTLLVVHEAGQRWAITDMLHNMRHYDLVRDGDVVRVVEEPQFYVAPAGAQIGALTFNPGFFLAGALRVGGLTWMTRVDVDPNRGIAAESALDGPLVVYKPEFFELTSADGTGGARFSMATYPRPEHPDTDCRNPHFLLDGQLNLIGLTAQAKVYVSTSGFRFQVAMGQSMDLDWRVIKGSVSTSWALEGVFEGVQRLGVGGALNYAVSGRLDIDKLLDLDGVELGVIDLDLAVSGSLDLGYDSNGAHADLAGSFTFQGVTTQFSVSQAASSARMSKFFDLVFARIKGAFKDRLADADDFVDGLVEGWVRFTDDVDQLAAGLQNGFDVVDKEMARLLRRCDVSASDIGRILEDRFGAGAAQVAGWLKDSGAAATEVASALAAHFALSHTDGAKLLKDIGYSADAVVDALKLDAAWNATGAQAIGALTSAGFAHADIGAALKRAFSLDRSALVDLAVGADYGSTMLTRLLRGAFPGISASDVAKVLKGVGKGSLEVANRLRDEFGQHALQVASTLKAVGYTSHDIARALNNAYSWTEDAVAIGLREVGFACRDVGAALYSYFSMSSDDAAKLLASLHFGADDIAGTLKSSALWDKSCRATGEILKKADFGKSTIKDALKAAGWSTSAVDDVIDSIF
ncbi:MAG: hypothetical protein R3B09_05800 [Nannocystaceae bacterium]